MDKNNQTKIIAIIALFIAVVSLTVGFAAYSKSFTINSTNTTTVKKGSDPFAEGLYLTVETGNGTVGNTGSNPTNVGLIWSGLTGVIEENSRTITYTATLHNVSSYIAYLNKVVANGNLSCAAVDASTTNSATVEAACDDLTLTLNIGSFSDTITTSETINTTGTVLNIDDNAVAKTEGTTSVTLTLTLDSDAVMPDGDFIVTIPEITFDYTSLKASS